jgi:hypothetical protein
MWNNLETFRLFVDTIEPAFTQPSLATQCSLFLAWIMCLGKHHLNKVFATAHPQSLPDHSQRHGMAPYYNFFERSAWTPSGLAQCVGVFLFTRLALSGVVTLLVDDTLVHKRGKSVWGTGWFRDAVASTKKRVATASGHNWVLLAVAFRSPVGRCTDLRLAAVDAFAPKRQRQPQLCGIGTRHGKRGSAMVSAIPVYAGRQR